jgi:hypothetical protein
VLLHAPNFFYRIGTCPLRPTQALGDFYQARNERSSCFGQRLPIGLLLNVWWLTWINDDQRGWSIYIDILRYVEGFYLLCVHIYVYLYIYVGVQVHRVCFHVFRFKLLFLLQHCLVLFKVCAPQKALLILCSVLWPWLLGWWFQICLVFHPFRWWFRLTLWSWDGLTYIYTYHKVYIYIIPCIYYYIQYSLALFYVQTGLCENEVPGPIIHWVIIIFPLQS